MAVDAEEDISEQQQITSPVRATSTSRLLMQSVRHYIRNLKITAGQ